MKAHALTAGTGAAAVTVIAAGALYIGGVWPHTPNAPGPGGAGPSIAVPGVTPTGRAGTPAPTASTGAGGPAGPGSVPHGVGATASVGVNLPSLPSAIGSPPPLTSPSPSVGVGVLVSSTTVVPLRLGVTASFTLTAQGGPVAGIQIQNPDPLDLTISLGTRSLAAGQTTTVRVTMVKLLGSPSTLVVNPGELTITVRPALLG